MARRRSKGDGGLYQRHDHPTCPPLDDDGNRPVHRCRGRWVGNVEVIDADGRRRRKPVYARTQKAALIKLNQALRERDQGTLVLASTTVEKWLAYWLEHIAAPENKAQTMRSYRSKVRLYLVPIIGRHRLTALRPEHVRALYQWMRDDGRADGTGGLAEATVRQTHAILKKSLSDAVKDGKLSSNPVDRVKAPSTEKNKRAQLTPAQAAVVLAAAGDDARWWLALFYGMRQGECLGLRWCDVDFEHHTLRIEQALVTDDDYRLAFDKPKSRASRRPLPLMPQMEARLRLAHVDAGEPAQEPRCDGVTGQCAHGLVFTEAGHPWWPNDDWARWRDLLVSAGVPHVALHSARGSAASLLEAAGAPDRLVMQILGHSQVQITHGYQDADLDRMRQAFDAVGRLLELEQ